MSRLPGESRADFLERLDREIGPSADAVDPRADRLARLVAATLANEALGSPVTRRMLATASIRGALAGAWDEGFADGIDHEHHGTGDAPGNPFSRGCV